MRVYVSSENIAEGKQAHDSQCAVALAIREQLPLDYTVSVCGDRITVGKKPIYAYMTEPVAVASMPEEMDKFIVKFDMHRNSVSPTEFTLDFTDIRTGDTWR